MCKCGCSQSGMHPDFMEKLEVLRVDYGHSINLSSAFRCPDYNLRISKKTGSAGPHTTGKAVDILVSGARAHKLMRLAFLHGFPRFGISQHGYHNKRFIHLDALNGESDLWPWVWSYPKRTG